MLWVLCSYIESQWVSTITKEMPMFYKDFFCNYTTELSHMSFADMMSGPPWKLDLNLIEIFTWLNKGLVSLYFDWKMANGCNDLLKKYAHLHGKAAYKVKIDFVHFWLVWKSMFGMTAFSVQKQLELS